MSDWMDSSLYRSQGEKNHCSSSNGKTPNKNNPPSIQPTPIKEVWFTLSEAMEAVAKKNQKLTEFDKNNGIIHTNKSPL